MLKKIYIELKERVKKSKLEYYNVKEELKESFKKFREELQKIKNNEYMQLLTNGNAKLPEHVASWSMSEGIFCNGACQKCKNCYVGGYTCLRHTCRKSYNKNGCHILATLKDRFYKKLFYENMYKNVLKNELLYKNSIVRWHVSGDFFNIKYFKDFLQFTKNCHKKGLKTIFMAYTSILSNRQVLYYNNTCKNLHLISSFIEYKENGKNKKRKNFFDLSKDTYIKELETLEKIAIYFREYNKKLDTLYKKGKISKKYHDIHYKKIGVCNYALDRKNKDIASKYIELIENYPDIFVISHGHECLNNCNLCLKLQYIIFVKH